MRFTICFQIAICLLIGCSTTNKVEIKDIPTDSFSWGNDLAGQPDVVFSISIADSVVKFGEEINLKIRLTNKSEVTQKLIFDKPKISTGGPWTTLGTVINVKTGKSVLEYQNKAVLSSQLYILEDSVDYYYYLSPNHFMVREFSLDNIVVFDSDDNKLPKGQYRIELDFYGHRSNKLILTVE